MTEFDLTLESDNSVLVIEDDADFAKVLAEVLTMSGYVVTVVRTNAHALALLEERRFRVALVDMRVLDGGTLPAAKQLQALHVPYVLMSSTWSPDLPEPYRSIPFISKPFRLADLLQRLKAA